MSINLAGANTYFTAHPRKASWDVYTTPARTAAVTHAKRLLSRLVDGGLTEAVTTDADFPRHDLAVYEQALWLLQQSPSLRDGNEAAPVAEATDPDEIDGARQTQAQVISPEARRWISRDGLSVMYGW